MPRFRKRPVEIEAVQLTWANWQDICSLTEKSVSKAWGVTLNDDGKPQDKIEIGPDERIGLMIETLEGTMVGRENDWIILGVQGELYPCKPDIFEATYEAVTVEETTRSRAMRGGYPG
jgi:hypothetical protein